MTDVHRTTGRRPGSVSDLDGPSPAETLDGASTVEVRTTASAALIPTIRAVASDLAARADFDLDAISDLRMAVDEVSTDTFGWRVLQTLADDVAVSHEPGIGGAGPTVGIRLDKRSGDLPR
jgi:serine/threonine-protein kinase RsbW